MKKNNNFYIIPAKYTHATLLIAHKGYKNIIIIEKILWKWSVKVLCTKELLCVYDDEFTIDNFT